jgi:regulator of sirC expression with transglutaminase-like and TPR domain
VFQPNADNIKNALELKKQAQSAQPEEALQMLNQAISLHGSSGSLYSARGQVFLQLKKPRSALCDLNLAAKLSPDDTTVRYYCKS